MEVKKIKSKETATYEIAGRIDTQTAPELQKRLDNDMDKGEKSLVLDFKDVEYVSSAGLRAVLHAQKRINETEGAKMSLINVSPEVFEVFEMTGFTDFLTINE